MVKRIAKIKKIGSKKEKGKDIVNIKPELEDEIVDSIKKEKRSTKENDEEFIEGKSIFSGSSNVKAPVLETRSRNQPESLDAVFNNSSNVNENR